MVDGRLARRSRIDTTCRTSIREAVHSGTDDYQALAKDFSQSHKESPLVSCQRHLLSNCFELDSTTE